MMTRAVILPVTLLCACAVWLSSAGESHWDQAARDQITNIHNDYRRKEGGCQMNKFIYNMTLEKEAKAWAEGCAFHHQHKGRGENLAFRTDPYSESELITAAMAGWFSEKSMYTRGQMGCDMSCHYTQLVWDTIQRMGCYSTRCPNLSGGAANAWYLVCFYDPEGNQAGQDPYQTSCDSPCRLGQTEEDGLCLGEAIIPCVNTNKYCKDWAAAGHCQSNKKYMEKNCRKACKLCEGGEDEEEEEEVEQEAEEEKTEEFTQPEEEDLSGPCEDKQADCVAWAAVGHCDDNKRYMLRNCRKACTGCEGASFAGPCEDKDPQCGTWAGRGYCKTNAGYMLADCKKACGVC